MKKVFFLILILATISCQITVSCDKEGDGCVCNVKCGDWVSATACENAIKAIQMKECNIDYVGAKNSF